MIHFTLPGPCTNCRGGQWAYHSTVRDFDIESPFTERIWLQCRDCGHPHDATPGSPSWPVAFRLRMMSGHLQFAIDRVNQDYIERMNRDADKRAIRGYA